MARIESTVHVTDIPAIVADSDRGLISLVGDRDGLSMIIGDIHLPDANSEVTAMAVETEHGTLYLDPDTTQVISEDDGINLDERCFEGALIEVDDAVTTLLADSFDWFVGDDRAQIHRRRGALGIAVTLIGEILDQFLMEYPVQGRHKDAINERRDRMIFKLFADRCGWTVHEAHEVLKLLKPRA